MVEMVGVMDQADRVNRDIARECMTALDVLRVAKNAFFWIAVVTIGLHLAAWFGARTGGAASSPGGEASAVEGETGGAETDFDASNRTTQAIESQLSLIGFVGRSSVLIVNGAFMLALFVVLIGRLGGTAGLTKACVWSLASLAMVAPWVSAETRPMIVFRSAFYTRDDIYSSGDGWIVLVRFVVCPVLVAVFLLVAQLEFRAAYKRITAPSGARLPIHEV